MCRQFGSSLVKDTTCYSKVDAKGEQQQKWNYFNSKMLEATLRLALVLGDFGQTRSKALVQNKCCQEEMLFLRDYGYKYEEESTRAMVSLFNKEMTLPWISQNHGDIFGILLYRQCVHVGLREDRTVKIPDFCFDGL